MLDWLMTFIAVSGKGSRAAKVQRVLKLRTSLLWWRCRWAAVSVTVCRPALTLDWIFGMSNQ